MDNMESRLVRLVQKGDQRAFAELVELYKDRIFHLSYRMLGNRHEAEDLVQETFCVCIVIWKNTIMDRSSQPGFIELLQICALIVCEGENLHTHLMLK